MSEFKETEIGSIPKNWDIKQFKDVLKIKGRIGWKGYKTTDLREDGPIVLGGTNINSELFIDYSEITHLSREKYEESPEIMLKPGDVILVTRGNGLGDVGCFNGEYEEATINPSLVILSDFKGDSTFLFYFLKSKVGRHQVLSLEGGSSIPALYQSHIKNLYCPFPPLSEMRTISKFLRCLDLKINNLKLQNQTLEKIAQTLFKRWFVEFEFPFEFSQDRFSDSVQGELFDFSQGRPTEAGKPYTSSGGSMVSSELGEIPAGWRVSNLSKFAKVIDCLHSKKPEQVSPKESKFFLLQVYNIGQNGFIDLSETYNVSTDDYKEWTRRIELQGGDLIISKTGRVGEIAQIPKYLKTGIGRNLVAIRSKRNYAKPFLRDLMLSNWMRRIIRARTSAGTVMTSIHVKDIEKLEFIEPKEEVLIKYNSLLSPIHDKINHNLNEIQTLTRLRDILLPKLMSGKIRV